MHKLTVLTVIGLLAGAGCGGAQDAPGPDAGSGSPDRGTADAAGLPTEAGDGATLLAAPDASPAGPDAAAALPDASLAAPDAAADAGPDPVADAGRPPLFANAGFETVGPEGQPAGWTCRYFGTGPEPGQLCPVFSDGGRSFVELAPGVALFQDSDRLAASKHLRFEALARSDEGVSAEAFYLWGYDAARENRFTLFGRSVEPDTDGWSRVSSVASAPADGCAGVRMIVYNGSGSAPLRVDELSFAELDAPVVLGGHLLRAEHFGSFRCAAGAEEAIVWVPLPLAHGVQVPLHLGLAVDPPSAVTRVEYARDAEGNFGARLHVAPEASFAEIGVHWEGVVLTREATDAELADLSPAGARPPSDWLAPTAIVQWQDPELKGAVEAALAGLSGASDPEGAMAKVLGWSSTWVTNPSDLMALDALSVFRTRNASCTGYANLAAAGGRAAGVPTRTVANYLVGSAQQTHSINEFWLGPAKGWRLVEPQGTARRLPADYAVVVRIDLPEDEGPGALDFAQNWAMPGVPLHSLVMPEAGAARCTFTWPAVPLFPECPYCDNKATYQAALDNPPVVVDLFDRAGVLWAATLERLTTTGADAKEQALRARALAAKDVQAVQALIEALEARR